MTDITAAEEAARALVELKNLRDSGQCNFEVSFIGENDYREYACSVCGATDEGCTTRLRIAAGEFVSHVPALLGELERLREENARLQKPDHYWPVDYPDYVCDCASDVVTYQRFSDVVKCKVGRAFDYSIWIATECVSLDEEGDPDKTAVREFRSEGEALRCWPESVARLSDTDTEGR